MKWLEIAVSTPPEGVEPVAAIFEEIGAGGVVIEDPAVILRYAKEIHSDEWAVPPAAVTAGMPVVKGYLPVNHGLPGRVEEVRAALGRLLLKPEPGISTRTLSEEDWANAWKAYYKPVRVGRRLVVKPSWEDYSPGKGERVIEMDPGMAFGSGTHETTSLCLQLLEEYLQAGMVVYDVGTGSGILAIAAALLGAGRTVAVDIDPVACQVAEENARRNAVAGNVQVLQGNLLDLVQGHADLVLSNIIARVIIGFAPDAARALTAGGKFIASGIIRERAPEVRSALEASGLTLCEERADGQWLALVAEKRR